MRRRGISFENSITSWGRSANRRLLRIHAIFLCQTSTMRLAAGGSVSGILSRRLIMSWKAPGLLAARSKVALNEVQSSSTLEEEDRVLSFDSEAETAVLDTLASCGGLNTSFLAQFALTRTRESTGNLLLRRRTFLTSSKMDVSSRILLCSANAWLYSSRNQSSALGNMTGAELGTLVGRSLAHLRSVFYYLLHTRQA
jgi:hypothetical protein